MLTKPKVLIGMPSVSGSNPCLTTLSLFALQRPCPVGLIVPQEYRTDHARNIIVKEVVQKDWDYLLFIDDDNPVPKDTLVKLLEDDKDIVSVPILSRRADPKTGHWLCAFYSQYFNELRFYFPVEKFREEGYLHKVDAVGMGCTLIKRNVLEVLYQKYKDFVFEFTVTNLKEPIQLDDREVGGRRMSEDLEFSERATDAGFEIWLDTRICPIHLGEPTHVQWSDNG